VRILGVSFFTGGRYQNSPWLKASIRQKKEALEKTSVTPYYDVKTSWQKDKKLLEWLKELGK